MLNKSRNIKNIFSIIIVLIVSASSLYLTFNTGRFKTPSKIIAWDVISYYSYLPATFIEKDYKLTFLKDFEHYWPETTEDGAYVIRTTMGLSIMYSPFFFIAHWLAPEFGFEADGFTQPYALALILSSIFFVFLGFLFLRKLLLKYYSDLVVGIVLLIIGLGTNLFWYTTIAAPMSHAYSFALFAIFLYLTEKWHRKISLKNSVLLGLVFGLISLIRPTNSLIILVFAFYKVSNFRTFKEKFILFRNNFLQLFIIAFFAFLVCLPQFLYWKSLTGEFLYFSYGSDQNFFFQNPKIFKVLFSFRKGWLVYTPVMIFALLGFILMVKTETKQYLLAILLFTAINIYVISSWWCWWYGGGFGMRALIESYALFAIPLAAFFSWLLKQKLKKRIFLLLPVIMISLQSAFHTVQYYYGAIHWDSMTKEAYFDSFWRSKRSEDFKNKIKPPDYEAAKKGIR